MLSSQLVAGRVLHVNTELPEEEAVTAVSSVIETGGTVIYPSDTVYGIIADYRNRAACETVAEIKGYKAIRPFIILIPDIASALTLTTGAHRGKYMQLHWPGPVTLVFKASSAVPEWLVSSSGTVALRQPAHRLTAAIMKATGRFLITTSANRRGEPFPLDILAINSHMVNSVDLTLNAGQLMLRRPSRILDCTGSMPVEVRN
ncbi:MAG: Sua5/YciO/YrdC/YwlC family protein [Candidatus Sabulitectum sp.]|nr:Sua5/YciO/YrdC/YwlC family protein [Candidatus Sabulitectum sp.]